MKSILAPFCFLLLSAQALAQNEEYIKTGSGIIHLTSYGSGQPILIINGGPGMNSKGFRALAQIMGKSNKAIIYDQRGTGESKLKRVDTSTITMDSMISDIEVIRNHLNIKQWVVFGHSFGGMLASYYASKFPEKLSGLILSSSGGINMEAFSRINITGRLSKMEQDSLSFWRDKIANGDTSYFARLQKGKFLAPAYLYNRANIPIVAERLTQADLKVNALVFQNMRKIGFDCSEKLKQLTIPVLIIQGKEDIIDLETAETAKDALPNSKLVILKNCGHYGWLDQPELYFQNIAQYLEKLDG